MEPRDYKSISSWESGLKIDILQIIYMNSATSLNHCDIV